MNTEKTALKKIIKLIEKWADDHKADHNSLLLSILETALKATEGRKK
jgi:hypothetical protein